MLTHRRHLAALLAVVLAFVTSACPGEGQAELRTRVVRAVGAIPEVVRVLAPDTDPKVLDAVDAGVALFNAFASDPTARKWSLAVDGWNAHVKGRLLALNNERIRQIVLVTDILIGQVIVPETKATRGAAGPEKVKTEFEEKNVKALERLVRPGAK